VLRGNIGESDAGQLRSVLVEALMRRRPRRLVVDLTDAATLDATAIGALVAARDTGPDMRIAVDVRRPNSSVTADLARHGL
jgi:anti-anti-sigma regulatory factor